MGIVRLIDGTAGGTERVESGAAAAVLGYSILYKDGDSSNINTVNKVQGLMITVEDNPVRFAFDGVNPSPGADQSELIVNQVARDFSGGSAWADVGLSAYSESDDLTITADGVGQYAELAVAEAPQTELYQYRLKIDIANLVSTWEIQDFTGVQVLGTVSAEGTQVEFDYIVDAAITGGFRIVSLAADSSADFDNFTLKRLSLGNKFNDGDIFTIRNWHSINSLRHINDKVGSTAVLQITPEY